MHLKWIRRWLRGMPGRRATINAIVAGWGWSRAAATHAVDEWDFYPWKHT